MNADDLRGDGLDWEQQLSPPIRRVQIRNYKSIASCSVQLGRLVFLVGPNGAGKSNFLDALRFVTDGLSTTLEHALQERGGIQLVRRNSRGHPTHFGVRLDLTLSPQKSAFYSFKIGAQRDGGFVVQREECRIKTMLREEAYFAVEEGKVTESSAEVPSLLEKDRLALVALSGLPEFRGVYDVLRGMGFYNLNPQRIRDLQDPDPGQKLARDGRNLASVVRELARLDGGKLLTQVVEHLRAVVPGVVSVEHEAIGPKETLMFKQVIKGDENPWGFLAASMSDGTLRALGVLVAAFHAAAGRRGVGRFVAIEEPEIALHPGAVEVIANALLLASHSVQVLVTTHSPEILSHKDISDGNLLAVSNDEGNTVIGPVHAAARSALRDRLYHAGELLSQGRLEPDPESVSAENSELQLFSKGRD